MAESVKIDVDVNVNPLKKMKQELKEIKGEMIGVTDEAKFAELAEQAAELETELNRVNSAVAEISKSGEELPRMASTLGGVGKSLASLDFAAASEGASRLNTISKQMTFASAINGIKNLGKTFLTLGKALLANPLFLLASIIVGIVIGIYKLLDSLGIIKKIFDAIGAAIGAVVQALKDFLDWLGITSFEKDKEHEREMRRIEAEKEARESLQKTFIRQQELVFKKEQRNHDFRIMQLEEWLKEGVITEKEFREQREESFRLAEEQELDLARTKKYVTLQSITDGRLELDVQKQILFLRLGATKAYFKSVNALELDFQQKIKEARDIFDDVEDKIEQRRYQRQKEEENRNKMSSKQSQKRIEDDYNNRLRAARLIEDLQLKLQEQQINLMEDGFEKQREFANLEVEINRVKHRRLKEDTLRDKNLTEEEKLNLTKLYAEEEAGITLSILDKTEKEILKKKQEYDKRANDLLFSISEDNLIKKIKQFDNYKKDELEKLQKALDEELITQEKFDDVRLALEDNYQRQLEELRQTYALKQEEFDPIQIERDNANDLLKIQEELLEAKLINEQEYAANVLKIKTDLANREKIISTELKAIAIENTAAIFNNLSQLGEQGSAIQKGFALTSIIADTAASLMKAVPVALEASKATGPAAPFVFAGVLSGIIGTITAAAANAKQVLSSVPGGGVGGGGGNISVPQLAGSTGITQPGAQTPNFEFFGNPNEGSTNISEKSGENNVIKAYVLQSEIQNLTDTLDKIKNKSQL
jgi:hypothetical protein